MTVLTFLDFVMRGWSYNVLYVYRRTTNDNDDDDDDSHQLCYPAITSLILRGLLA